MSKKKVAVIGSGIGGSGIAALLAHYGAYEVNLYEKNKMVGGRFANYSPRKGYRMDLANHGCVESHLGKMHEILNRLGEPDAVKWNVFKNPITVYFKGSWVKYPEEMDKMGLGPDELEQVMKFYEETLSIPEDEIEAYNEISVRDQLGKFVKSEWAHAIFDLMVGLAFALPSDKVPLGDWSMVERGIALKRAVGHPYGGTGAIPEAYVRLMEKHGGRLHLATPVECIVVEEGVARGVKLTDGTVNRYDIVISNAGNKEDLDLVGRHHFSKELLEKVDGYQYSASGTVLHMGLDQPIVDPDKDVVMYLGSKETDLLGAEEGGDPSEIPEMLSLLMIPIISNIDPDSCPEGKQVVSAMIGGYHSLETPEAYWENLEKAVLNTLEIIWPGISGHIEWKSIKTPAFWNQLFGEEGAGIGIAQQIGQVGKNRPFIVDPEIENLYHCSADSGVIGIGGELAADSALRLFEKLTAT